MAPNRSPKSTAFYFAFAHRPLQFVDHMHRTQAGLASEENGRETGLARQRRMKINPQVADMALSREDAAECAAPVAWPARPGSPQDVADLAAKIAGASGASLALETSSGEIVCAASSGETAPAAGAVLNCSHGISALCVRRGAVQRCADTETDPRVDAEVCRQLGIRSMVVLPLRRGGRVAGLLSVYSRQVSMFDRRDVARLKYLQSVAAGLADAAEAEAQPVPALAELRPQRSGARRRIITLGIFAMAALALAGLRLARMRGSGSGAQLPPSVAPSSTAAGSPKAPPPGSVAENAVAAESAPGAESGMGHVQSIKASSDSGYARVTIGLDRGVQYAAYRLDRPERIYFDLRRTRFAPGVRPHTDTVGGPALRAIRCSQYARDVVRVVLDLNARAGYSAEFQANPPRLVIEVTPKRQAPLRTADRPAAAPSAGPLAAPES